MKRNVSLDLMDMVTSVNDDVPLGTRDMAHGHVWSLETVYRLDTVHNDSQVLERVRAFQRSPAPIKFKFI